MIYHSLATSTCLDQNNTKVPTFNQGPTQQVFVCLWSNFIDLESHTFDNLLKGMR